MRLITQMEPVETIEISCHTLIIFGPSFQMMLSACQPSGPCLQEHYPYLVSPFVSTTERKRVEENFHPPADKLVFYSMADIQTKHYLFKPENTEVQVDTTFYSKACDVSAPWGLIIRTCWNLQQAMLWHNC